jgi:hypothetical protein
MQHMDKTEFMLTPLAETWELMKQNFFPLLGFFLILSNIIILTSMFTTYILIFQICIGQRQTARGRKAASTPGNTTPKHLLKKTWRVLCKMGKN